MDRILVAKAIQDCILACRTRNTSTPWGRQRTVTPALREQFIDGHLPAGNRGLRFCDFTAAIDGGFGDTIDPDHIAARCRVLRGSATHWTAVLCHSSRVLTSALTSEVSTKAAHDYVSSGSSSPRSGSARAPSGSASSQSVTRRTSCVR